MFLSFPFLNRYICAVEEKLNMNMRHPLSFFRFCPQCGSSHFEEHEERSKKCRNCEFVYYLNAAAAVAAIIINEKEEMLLCRRAYDPYKGTLDLPGGFIDLNESAEKALRREVEEEIGAGIKTMRYFCSYPNVYPYSGFEVRTLDIFFLCTLPSNAVLVPKDDVSDLYFISINKVNENEIKLSSIRKVVETVKHFFKKGILLQNGE